MPNVPIRAILAFALPLALSLPSWGSGKPWTVDDILKLRDVSDVQVSPDGARAVFVVTEANDEENSYNTDLYLAAIPAPGATSPERVPISHGWELYGYRSLARETRECYASASDEVTEGRMRRLLSITKALGDETRVRALLAVKDGELCLCQIIEVLGLSPSTVSKHMNVLQHAGLVRCRKQGKWRFYPWAGTEADRVGLRALAWVREETRGDPTIEGDTRRIRAVRRRSLEELSACYRG